MHRFTTVLALLISAFTPAPVSASTIQTEFATYSIAPGSTITVRILVSGGGDIQGANIGLLVGDGGINYGDLSRGTLTSPPAPVVTSLSLNAPGTIFAGNNTGHSIGQPPPDLYVVAGTTTATGTVNANNGVLAIAILSLPANAPVGQSYLLSFEHDDSAIGGTRANPITEWIGATINTPEPATLSLLLVSGLMMRRKHRWA